MTILYKFIDDLVVLREMTFLASDPAGFNDPFEVRPCYDQEAHDHFAAGREAFDRLVGGDGDALTGSGSMVGMPVENVFGLADDLNKRFRGDLSTRFRALCLSSSTQSVLMWAHYGRLKGGAPYSGVAIGIDTDHPDFPAGLRAGGFSIGYEPDRTRNTLPLAYYLTPGPEMYGVGADGRWGLINPPRQLVRSGSLYITFADYQQQLEAAFLKALTTKAACWSYEEEVRFLYDLRTETRLWREADKPDRIRIPPGALKQVILGPQATAATAEEITNLFHAGTLGTPALFFSDCHPFEYAVRKNDAPPDYILAWYRTILPSHAPRVP